MRYTIKCSECGKSFVAESQTPGKVRYRCPHCGNVMTCLLNAPHKSVVTARYVVPVTDGALLCGRDGKRLQLVAAVPVGVSVQAAGGGSPSASRRFWNALVWLCSHVGVFFSWSSDRISRFREKYDDADLWLFFGFSILFLIAVALGLFVSAELTKLIVSGHSWLVKTYYEVIH